MLWKIFARFVFILLKAVYYWNRGLLFGNRRRVIRHTLFVFYFTDGVRVGGWCVGSSILWLTFRGRNPLLRVTILTVHLTKSCLWSSCLWSCLRLLSLDLSASLLLCWRVHRAYKDFKTAFQLFLLSPCQQKANQFEAPPLSFFSLCCQWNWGNLNKVSTWLFFVFFLI